MKRLLCIIVVVALMQMATTKAEAEEMEVAAGKEKVTFNLSAHIIELLDDVWMTLRKQLRDQQRVTKTYIVEQALEIILRDFESEGTNSLLCNKVFLD